MEKMRSRFGVSDVLVTISRKRNKGGNICQEDGCGANIAKPIIAGLDLLQSTQDRHPHIEEPGDNIRKHSTTYSFGKQILMRLPLSSSSYCFIL